MSNAPDDYALRGLWLVLGFVGCGVVLYACLIPNPPQANVTFFDKYEHFAAFAVLGTWFGAVLAPRYGVALIGLALFGALIELLQSLTSYRSGDPMDFLADGLGLIAGVGFARVYAVRWLRYIDRRVAAKGNSAG